MFDCPPFFRPVPSAESLAVGFIHARRTLYGLYRRFPHIDLAILENGQYNEDWRYIHTIPEQLPAEIHELDAAKVLPVHNSKFSLSRHAWDEPVHRIEQAATKDSSLHVIHGIIGSPIIY